MNPVAVRLAALLFLVCPASAARPAPLVTGPPELLTDDHNSLHINTTQGSEASVFINGIDVLQRIEQVMLIFST